MSNRQLRLQELAEAERRIAATRKVLSQGKSDHATARDSTAARPEQSLDSAQVTWLTFEFRRLEVLRTTAVRETAG